MAASMEDIVVGGQPMPNVIEVPWSTPMMQALWRNLHGEFQDDIGNAIPRPVLLHPTAWLAQLGKKPNLGQDAYYFAIKRHSHRNAMVIAAIGVPRHTRYDRCVRGGSSVLFGECLVLPGRFGDKCTCCAFAGRQVCVDGNSTQANDNTPAQSPVAPAYAALLPVAPPATPNAQVPVPPIGSASRSHPYARPPGGDATYSSRVRRLNLRGRPLNQNGTGSGDLPSGGLAMRTRSDWRQNAGRMADARGLGSPAGEGTQSDPVFLDGSDSDDYV